MGPSSSHLSCSGAEEGRAGGEGLFSGPGEEECSGGSEDGAAGGTEGDPTFDGACGEERGEHERPGPDEHPQTTAEQDGGGRETPSPAVTGANSHCRHRLPPSLT